ncbi:hypothetical protein TNCV_4464791 [Trichonephila clavipes]|nr:hypothetical protein TNCV_4464791 [Trichonephila clavipes]
MISYKVRLSKVPILFTWSKVSSLKRLLHGLFHSVFQGSLQCIFLCPRGVAAPEKSIECLQGRKENRCGRLCLLCIWVPKCCWRVGKNSGVLSTQPPSKSARHVFIPRPRSLLEDYNVQLRHSGRLVYQTGFRSVILNAMQKLNRNARDAEKGYTGSELSKQLPNESAKVALIQLGIALKYAWMTDKRKPFHIASSLYTGSSSPVVNASDHDRHSMSSSPVPIKTRRVGRVATHVKSVES